MRLVGYGVFLAVFLGVLMFAGFTGHGSSILPKAQAQEPDEETGCSVATLNGSYGFYRTGVTPAGPIAAVGIIDFDGQGTVSARQTIRRNGVTTSDMFTTPPVASPYEVNADCSGRLLAPDGTVISHIVIVGRGEEVYNLGLNTGNTVYAVLKRIRRHGRRDD